ncbi:Alpha/Beta hydrolase protein [Mycena filopes]|nr:Alpha/Beta hydrolase protein [Mycena filopes]
MVPSILLLAFATTTLASPLVPTTSARVKPFLVDLAAGIPHLKTLVKNTHLPAKPLYPGAGSDWGVQLDFLHDLQTQLNKFAQFTTNIGNQTVHFLLHGWPGSFQEFLPVVKPLTQPWTSPTGKTISYNVVVPSLPGFVFSSAPPQNWTNADTAQLFNTLMTDVLGYSKYALHATDWGAGIGYDLYKSYNASVRAAHFVDANITLSNITQVTLQRGVEWSTIGNGYFQEQTFKLGIFSPMTSVLALYDNPVGQLAWVGGNIKLWSDPRAGTPPSELTSTAILTATSLYYLTRFLPILLYTKALTDAPMLFSVFKYPNLLRVGNLVSYKEHDFGGHFAGIDNPPALIEDLREMGTYFE